MSRNPALPLTEPQARRVNITLADLERQLHDLRETLLHPPRDLRLTRHEGGFGPAEAEALFPAIEEAERQLQGMADDLRLEAALEPVRRSFQVGLELANIALYEVRPSGGFRGYGSLAAVTAAYLEREIPRLETAVLKLLQLLRQSAPPDRTRA